MGLFRKRNQISDAQRQAEAAVAARNSVFNFNPQGPELAVRGADQASRAGDHRRAFELAVESVDRLHDFYVFERFAHRRPSAADQPMIDSVTRTLAELRRAEPDADVTSGVKEATHRLRTISTSIDSVGGESTRYRHGLDDLARIAPDVDVSGVFWN